MEKEKRLPHVILNEIVSNYFLAIPLFLPHLQVEKY